MSEQSEDQNHRKLCSILRFWRVFTIRMPVMDTVTPITLKLNSLKLVKYSCMSCTTS